MKHLQAAAFTATKAALQALASCRSDAIASGTFIESLPREMKAAADKILEEVILKALHGTGCAILSEETGWVEGTGSSNLHWVVDPLDGTVNFVRDIATCGVSIALCRDDQPIWGVVGEYPSGALFWGGRGYDAFCNGAQIHVSSVSKISEAVVCSGFPARFEFNPTGLQWVSESLANFAKVRMLGAASQSLLAVARGAAEAYTERDIMLWDVAAGLAIVEGAGGVTRVTKTHGDQLNVYASNGLI
jgi:myo-inositol-1(or 4)-monophosphatase